jgi:hypothetical protein
MPIDPELIAAVEEAADELDQSKAAKRLIKWLKDMSEQELDSADELQHLAALRSVVRTESQGGEE